MTLGEPRNPSAGICFWASGGSKGASAGTIVSVGGTLQVTATTRDAEGNVLAGRIVRWNVSDGSVVTIDGFGLMTGVAPGTATVEATAENVAATLDLSVQE
jgi:uncharacterized protein YjdB